MTGRQFAVATAALLLWTAWALTRVTAGLALVRPAGAAAARGDGPFALFEENR